MKSRNKDRKPHESIIGKIIYGFLLFMPLLAIGVTCAVNTFNDSPNTNTQTEDVLTPIYYQSNDVESSEDLIIGNIYYWANNYNTLSTSSTNVISINVSRETFEYLLPNVNYDSGYTYSINIVNNNSNAFIAYYLNGTYINNGQIQNKEFIFEFLGINNNNHISKLIPHIEKVEQQIIKEYETTQVVTYTQNDIFYYSVDKVEQSPLFNWAQDSAIYTGMTATCNALDISTTFIPLIMTYWLIISVIYILYDIILIILHIFHKKIHQLEDSF